MSESISPDSTGRPRGATDLTSSTEMEAVPTRRRLLSLGGTGLVGAAVLAACTKTGQPVEQLAQTGTTPTTAKADPSAGRGSFADDLTMLRVAQSIEAFLIEVYQKAIDAKALTTPAVLDTAQLFQSQHRDHSSQLERTITSLGGQPFTQVNKVVETNLAEKLSAMHSEAEAIALFIAAETIANESYAYDTGWLTTESLRSTLASIGATEGRHLSVLIGLETPNQPTLQVPFPTIKAADAVKLKSDAANAVGPGPLPAQQPTTSTTAPRTTTTKAAGTGTTKAGSTGTTAKKSTAG